MVDYTPQITAWYQAVQFRAPPAAELTSFNAALQTGALTQDQAIAGIENLPYTQSVVDPVIREFQAAFGRAPDQAGESYWVNVVASNSGALAQLNTLFADSAEFSLRFGDGVHGATPPNGAVVSALYRNVLQRAPDAAGLAYWVDSGQNAAQLLQAFSQSAEFVTNAASSIVNYQNDQIAGAPASAIDGTLSLFDPIVGGAPGGRFVLTAGADNLLGTTGNDTFIADNTKAGAYTLTVADAINGNGGTDTLKVYSDGTAGGIAGIGTAAISNIANIYVNNIGNNFLDVSGVAGVKSLQIDAPNGSPQVIVANQAVTFSNDANGVVHNFNIASASDTSESITLSNVGASWAHDRLDIFGSKVVSETIHLQGGTDFVDLFNTGGAVASIKIDGDQNLTAVLNAGLVGTVASLDISATTGKLDISAGTAVTSTGFIFSGGAGNDTLRLAAGEFATLTAGSQLDGGGGVNTLAINDAAPNYAKLNAVKNFQILELDRGGNVDDAQITAAFANHFVINNTGTTITNLVDGATIDVLQITLPPLADVLRPTGGATTLNLNIGSSSSAGLAGVSETVSGFAIVNVSSNGTGANTVTFANSDNTNFMVKGSADLVLGLSGRATVDASAFTGKLTVYGSDQGDILIGGSGNDTLVAGKQSSFMAGNGGSNTFDVSHTRNGVNGAIGQFDTITDFAKGTDKIVLDGGSNYFAATAVDVSSAKTLDEAAYLAVRLIHDGADWFQFGGDTYVATGFIHAPLNPNDVIVKLTGTIDLSTATLTHGVLA